jgi:hypothetical protein
VAGFKTCVVEVSFDAIKDAQVQRKFLNLATSFDLPSDTVDEVVAMGSTLIRESPYFVSLVRSPRRTGGGRAGVIEARDVDLIRPRRHGASGHRPDAGRSP